MTSSGYERLTFLYISTTVLLIVLQAHTLPISEDTSNELKSTNMTAEILNLLSSKGFSGNSSRKVFNSGKGTKHVRYRIPSKLPTRTQHSLTITTSPLQYPYLSNSSPGTRQIQAKIKGSIYNSLKLSNRATTISQSISPGQNPEFCGNGTYYSYLLNKCVPTSDRAPGVG